MTFFICHPRLWDTHARRFSSLFPSFFFSERFLPKPPFSIWPLMEYGNQQRPLTFMCVRLSGSRLFVLCEVNERLFGVTGNCAACSKMIPAFEMVMRARDNVYHLDCFACQLCRQRFCVGDKFFLKNNMILCQLDYEGGHLNGSAERQPQ
uniref:LIM domain only 1 n=1 Tax=Seriola dumerili TaxID=41447 RepID=A0A3B4T6Y9_SERDU